MGSLYQKGTVPMNLVPGIGDHTGGLFLSAGLLTALYKAAKTGKGDKVTVNLLHTSVFVQAIMLQAAQYPWESDIPSTAAIRTSLQLCL
jgi:cinnamoyl-CoA:phenyllactate CoA-transferase